MVTETIIGDLKKRGVFFRTTEGYFYFDKSKKPKLLPIEKESVELATLIQECFGINDAERREYEHIVSGLRNEAHLWGRQVQVHKLAYYDPDQARLYVSRFDGWVYRLDGNRIQLVPNGTDDVFFLDHPTWEPYEQIKGKVKGQPFEHLILRSANFKDHDELSAADQRWLFSVWCLSQFFDSLHPTKPLMLVCGEKGGGKTLCLRKWLKFLFGSGADVTALERSKPDGFVAAVCSSPNAVFDNVDEQVSWLPDHLAQLATGVSFKRRKYYTTNQEVEFKPRCFVALTSRTPKFVEGRDDVLDRAIVLQTERREQFDPEGAQLRLISSNRNLLWTEVLRNLNKIVGSLKESEGEVKNITFRMADFAAFAVRVARIAGQEEMARKILQKLESRRTDMLLAEEPICSCLERWLENSKNWGRPLTSGQLNADLAAVAAILPVYWPYQAPQALAQRLSHISRSLGERFDMNVTEDKHAKQKVYAFGPLGASEHQTVSEAHSLPYASSEKPAGFAGFTLR